MREKIYDETFKSDQNKTGYDYKDKLMKNAISVRFFAGNDMAETFVTYVNDILYESIESVKTLRNFFNYTVDKDQKDIK
jgi:hypothetical protein